MPDGRTTYLADVSGNDCLDCHEAIGEEWRWSTHATAWQDEHYPAAFRTLPDPPIVLYVRGRLHGPGPRIAVVGSRRATHSRPELCSAI